MTQNLNAFGNLTPDVILATATALGFKSTGQIFPYNSYENRVYEVTLENDAPVIVKFYRPERWSTDAILEEHEFLHRLVEAEVPVVPPLVIDGNISETLGEQQGYRYAVFNRFKGHERPDLKAEDREWLGRTIARIHNVGEHFDCKYRMVLSPDTYGEAYRDIILNLPYVPEEIIDPLQTHLDLALDLLTPEFRDDITIITTHGDCHLGNVLWNHEGPHLVDLDDMVIAPPIQDCWMLFHGSKEEQAAQRRSFFKGYRLFRDFEINSFRMIEPLRTLRMIRHCGWIGQRYEENIFKQAFPYYEERRYWEEFLLQLKEQIALLQDPDSVSYQID